MSGPEVQNLATNPKTQITKPRLTSAVVFSVFVVVFCTSGPLYKHSVAANSGKHLQTLKGALQQFIIVDVLHFQKVGELTRDRLEKKGQSSRGWNILTFKVCSDRKWKKSESWKCYNLSEKKKSILWNFFTDVQILYGNKVKKKNLWVQSEAELNANTEAHSYLLTRSVHKSLLSLQLMHSWCTECLGRPNIPVVKFVWMKQAGNSLRILSEHTFSPLVRVEIQNHGILHFP